MLVLQVGYYRHHCIPKPSLRILECVGFEAYGSRAWSTANAVYLWPVVVPHRVTVERIFFVHVAVAAGNWRAGIYADNGDTPVGGALLCESPSTLSNGTNRCQELTVPDTVLDPGLYWIALAASTTTDTYFYILPQLTIGCTLTGHAYALGAWGPLTNPCPATAAYYYQPMTGLRCEI